MSASVIDYPLPDLQGQLWAVAIEDYYPPDHAFEYFDRTGYLHKDGLVHPCTNKRDEKDIFEYSGYWSNKVAAEEALRKYLGKPPSSGHSYVATYRLDQSEVFETDIEEFLLSTTTLSEAAVQVEHLLGPNVTLIELKRSMGRD
jgi:hypothetical protein